MIHVEQGGKYPGETYLWCGTCQPNPLEVGPGLFQGAGMMELTTWWLDHLHLEPRPEAIAPDHTP